MRLVSGGLIWVLALVAGCGGDDDGGDETAMTDAAPEAIDGAVEDVDAATSVDCPGDSGGPVIDTESGFWSGPLVACGTVTLPEDAMAERVFQLMLHRFDGPTGNEFLGAGTTGEEPTVYFRLELAAGHYRIGIRIDDDANGSIAAGDIQGFYDGTTDTPIFEVGDATTIELSASRTDLDFGLGRLPE